MNTKLIFAMFVATCMVAFAIPPASANHGITAVYAANDGSEAWVAQYSGGNGDEQTWSFTSLMASCDAFGSIEVGFVGDCVTVGGTDHFHAYTGSCDNLDTHEVTVNGKPGNVVVLDC